MWRGLLHMSKWARRPPSDKRVKLVMAVLAICAALFAFEQLVGWPDGLRVNQSGAPRR